MSTPYRVLIVDDSDRWRWVLSSMFELDERFEVAAMATDGHEALETLDGLGPTAVDVVMLDVSMPGMDGIVAIPHIRHAAPQAAIVVFTATGNARVGEAQKLGVDGYCHKGAGVTEVIAHVEAAIARRRDSR